MNALNVLRTIALAIACLALLPAFWHGKSSTTIVPSMSASVSSCTAPCPVFFDLSGTTDVTTNYPFHERYYSTNFGDSGAGNWSYGSSNSVDSCGVGGQTTYCGFMPTTSRNIAIGPEVSHVYAAAGTYNVVATVTGPSGSASTSPFTVTVNDPNTIYGGVWCVNPTGACGGTGSNCRFGGDAGSPATSIGCTGCIGAAFTNCPGGAGNDDPRASGTTFAAIVSNYLVSGQGSNRVLLHAGETFNGSNSVTASLTCNSCQLGSFDTGAQPIIQSQISPPNGTSIITFGPNTTNTTLHDVQIDANGDGNFCSTIAQNSKRVLFWNVTCTGAYGFTGGTTPTDDSATSDEVYLNSVSFHGDGLTPTVGSPYAITSGSYTTGTGVVSLNMGSPASTITGGSDGNINISGLTGTGSVASLDGTFPFVSSVQSISSGTYNSGTGLVTLTMTASQTFVSGSNLLIAGLTGTGAFASLNGTFADVSVSGTTVTYTAATGLGATTITGGSLTPLNVLTYVGTSGLGAVTISGGNVKGLACGGELVFFRGITRLSILGADFEMSDNTTQSMTRLQAWGRVEVGNSYYGRPCNARSMVDLRGDVGSTAFTATSSSSTTMTVTVDSAHPMTGNAAKIFTTGGTGQQVLTCPGGGVPAGTTITALGTGSGTNSGTYITSVPTTISAGVTPNVTAASSGTGGLLRLTLDSVAGLAAGNYVNPVGVGGTGGGNTTGLQQIGVVNAGSSYIELTIPFTSGYTNTGTVAGPLCTAAPLDKFANVHHIVGVGNAVTNGGGNPATTIAPQGTPLDGSDQDIVFDTVACWLGITSSNGCFSIAEASNVTARNYIVNGQNRAVGSTVPGFSTTWDNSQAHPQPKNIWIYNSNYNCGANITGAGMIKLNTQNIPGTTIAKNNINYCQNAPSVPTVVDSSPSSSYVAAGNSDQVGGNSTTSPQWSNGSGGFSLYSDYAVGLSTYKNAGANSVPVWFDFAGKAVPQTTPTIGALQ